MASAGRNGGYGVGFSLHSAVLKAITEEVPHSGSTEYVCGDLTVRLVGLKSTKYLDTARAIVYQRDLEFVTAFGYKH